MRSSEHCSKLGGKVAGSATYKQSKTVRNCALLEGQFVYSVYAATVKKGVCLFTLFRHKNQSLKNRLF